jgi:hypothetical protein
MKIDQIIVWLVPPLVWAMMKGCVIKYIMFRCSLGRTKGMGRVTEVVPYVHASSRWHKFEKRRKNSGKITTLAVKKRRPTRASATGKLLLSTNHRRKSSSTSYSPKKTVLTDKTEEQSPKTVPKIFLKLFLVYLAFLATLLTFFDFFLHFPGYYYTEKSNLFPQQNYYVNISLPPKSNFLSNCWSHRNFSNFFDITIWWNFWL